MYVPPISGSDMRVWNALMPTNWIVLNTVVSRQIETVEK